MSRRGHSSVAPSAPRMRLRLRSHRWSRPRSSWIQLECSANCAACFASARCSLVRTLELAPADLDCQRRQTSGSQSIFLRLEYYLCPLSATEPHRSVETGSGVVGKVALSKPDGHARQSCRGGVFGIRHDPPEHAFEKANFLRGETGQ